MQFDTDRFDEVVHFVSVMRIGLKNTGDPFWAKYPIKFVNAT
jgi:hypothetical protein